MNKFSSLQAASASLISMLFSAAGEEKIDKERLFKEGEKLFIDEAVQTSGFEKAVAIYSVSRYVEIALLGDRALPVQTPAFQDLLEAAQWRLAEMSDDARGTSAPGFLFFGRTPRRDDLDAVLLTQGFMSEVHDETMSELRALRAQVSRLQATMETRHREVDARNAERRAAKPARVG